MLGLCEMFHALPSQVLAEDAGLLRMLRVRELGTPARREPAMPDVGGGEDWS